MSKGFPALVASFTFARPADHPAGASNPVTMRTSSPNPLPRDCVQITAIMVGNGPPIYLLLDPTHSPCSWDRTRSLSGEHPSMSGTSRVCVTGRIASHSSSPDDDLRSARGGISRVHQLAPPRRLG